MRFDVANTKFKIVEDGNGFITAEGIIATAGEKLRYLNSTETIGESALFESMDEWEGLPLTLNHPRTMLTPNSAPKHQVGSVVKAWRKDNQLWARFKITAKKAIDAVRSGVRGLSAGYLTNLDGATQVARQNNHLAIVPVGRSPSSGIRADERRDSFDINQEGKNMPVIKFPNGKEIRLDCSDAEAELMQGHIDALSARADTAETSLVSVSDFLSEHFDMEEDMDMSKKLDAMKEKIAAMKKDGGDITKLQAQYDALKEKLEKSKGKMDADELGAIFDTHEKALKLNAKIKIRKDTGEVKSMRELACEAMPEVKFDDKSDDYVMARLDASVEFASDKNVRNQRADGLEPPKSSSLTVQQKADKQFYHGNE